MAEIVVTNTNSSGAGSLAAAVTQANANAGADVIVFAKSLAGQSIALTGDLVLTSQVTINGDTNKDGDADITLNASGGRIVKFGNDAASLTSLVITGGQSADTAAIVNAGNLTLLYCDIRAPLAAGVEDTPVSIVSNSGTLSIIQSGFSLNSITGGAGYSPYGTSDGGDGGSAATIRNSGTLTCIDRFRFKYGCRRRWRQWSYLIYDTWRAGAGGDGGNAAGAILNSGTVSGSFGLSGNTATAGSGGDAGYGIQVSGNPVPPPDGANGSNANGLLNIGGTGSLDADQYRDDGGRYRSPLQQHVFQRPGRRRQPLCLWWYDDRRRGRGRHHHRELRKLLCSGPVGLVHRGWPWQ